MRPSLVVISPSTHPHTHPPTHPADRRARAREILTSSLERGASAAPGGGGRDGGGGWRQCQNAGPRTGEAGDKFSKVLSIVTLHTTYI